MSICAASITYIGISGILAFLSISFKPNGDNDNFSNEWFHLLFLIASLLFLFIGVLEISDEFGINHGGTSLIGLSAIIGIVFIVLFLKVLVKALEELANIRFGG